MFVFGGECASIQRSVSQSVTLQYSKTEVVNFVLDIRKKMIKFFDEFHREFFEMSSKKSNFSKRFDCREQIDQKKIYESMKSMKTENLLKILHRKIFNCYEFSKFIINDREKQMISKL